MDKLEIKANFSVDDAGTITGIAWPFGSPDAVGDVIHKGAFSIASAMPIFFEHDPDVVVGSWESVVETDAGLEARGRLFLEAVPRARDVHTRLRSGRVSGLSIGFRPAEAKSRPGGGRDIYALRVSEISIVANPSHPGARILNVKSADGAATPSSKDTSMEPELKNDPAAPEVKTADPVIDPKALDALKAEVKALKAATDKLEAKSNRPNAANANHPSADNDNALEMKALATCLRTGNDMELKAAATDNDPAGGYFVLPTVDTTIRNLLKDLSPMRALADVQPVNGNSFERFYSMGKRGAQRVTERGERPQDTARPELIKHSYGTGEYYAAPTATRQQLDDSSMDIASWFLTHAIHEFAISEGEDFLTGDGQDGFPKGLLTYPLAAEKDFTREWGKFQYVPAGSATPTDKQLSDALIKLVAALRKPYKGNAVFLMNGNTAVRVRQIVDSANRYLWAPTGNLIEGVDHPLLGYRVEIDDDMPDIGADTAPIAFGDFQQGYVIVDRQGITRPEPDTVTQKGRVIFDTYKRVGGGAGDFCPSSGFLGQQAA